MGKTASRHKLLLNYYFYISPFFKIVMNWPSVFLLKPLLAIASVTNLRLKQNLWINQPMALLSLAAECHR